MSEPPPKKKRKPGGSFCAMGGCSNRSSRDTASSHSRDFLRYIPLPKDSALKEAWLKRMKRDIKTRSKIFDMVLNISNIDYIS